MTRVLLIGIKPEAVDISDPDLPPGTMAEKIAAGIEAAPLGHEGALLGGRLLLDPDRWTALRRPLPSLDKP